MPRQSRAREMARTQAYFEQRKWGVIFQEEMREHSVQVNGVLQQSGRLLGWRSRIALGRFDSALEQDGPLGFGFIRFPEWDRFWGEEIDRAGILSGTLFEFSARFSKASCLAQDLSQLTATLRLLAERLRGRQRFSRCEATAGRRTRAQRLLPCLDFLVVLARLVFDPRNFRPKHAAERISGRAECQQCLQFCNCFVLLIDRRKTTGAKPDQVHRNSLCGSAHHGSRVLFCLDPSLARQRFPLVRRGLMAGRFRQKRRLLECPHRDVPRAPA